MSNEEIKKALTVILSKIDSNIIDAWEDDMENTKTVVITEDFEKGMDDDAELIEYNGWLEELNKLKDSL